MVATPDLGSGAERRGGSSPFIRTSTEQKNLLGFRLIKGLGQLVAPRQTCLRSVVVCCANIRVCCAIVAKSNFRPIAHQPRQSSIATTSLRSALGFCRRSSPKWQSVSWWWCGSVVLVFSFPFSVFRFNPVVQAFLPCGSEKCK